MEGEASGPKVPPYWEGISDAERRHWEELLAAERAEEQPEPVAQPDPER